MGHDQRGQLRRKLKKRDAKLKKGTRTYLAKNGDANLFDELFSTWASRTSSKLEDKRREAKEKIPRVPFSPQGRKEGSSGSVASRRTAWPQGDNHPLGAMLQFGVDLGKGLLEDKLEQIDLRLF